MQCIGATTVSEYRQYIEKDAALERRFQAVKVSEPTLAQTEVILAGLRPKYEEYHGVSYSDEALVAAAALASRYIADRFNPDKAIDLMDEAGASRQMEMFDEKEGALRPVEPADIAKVVADWTGIPVAKLTTDEMAGMANMEATLHKRVIGQEGAISAIARALRRARVGLRDPRRPVASLVFSGPTGVGKTELAKAVAEAYYGSEKAMVRLGLYKIFVYFEAVVHESTILPLFPPTCNARPFATLLHATPLPTSRVYAIHHTILVITKSCKCQGAARHVRVHGVLLSLAAHRPAARLRGLRGGRPADGGRAPLAALPGAHGRDREGTPGRLQHSATGELYIYM